MTTVRELADELEVSAQTIYNHIDKNKKALKPNMRKINNTTHLNDRAVIIIKESMGISTLKTVEREPINMDEMLDLITDKVAIANQDTLDNMSTRLENTITQAINSKEFERYETRIKELKDIIKEKDLRIKELEQELEEEKSKGVFDRIFKK